MVSLSFHISENIFTVLSFLEDIFAGYRILGWQMYFSTLMVSFHSFLASIVFNHRSVVCIILSVFVMCSFSLDAFRIISLFLVFTSLTMISTGMIFFVFILLRVHWASWLLVYVFNHLRGIFSSYFFRYFFLLQFTVSPLFLRLQVHIC